MQGVGAFAKFDITSSASPDSGDRTHEEEAVAQEEHAAVQVLASHRHAAE